ncbi:LON peptidase substrate-binding domain-containing protein [Alloacidobacterium dinghuense]|uniref:LON peptidase substrate-binding domain-containing protein n=1 Tax=Alloacidobacterium dinghuense TaxID=2763107 RepID=A0A7G8BDR9_9BACT|nr:LON peptidase substrate-binding domain-containing protein [Alloacidobacterium dinghuense]QNI30689.1 LON peptidase substrate-binding domain-containing protein [Alloacidobacterium dinghuense]
MKVPLFPLDVVLFPGTPLPLHIFEERYKEMITECLAEKTGFGVVRAQREGLAVIGCMARIIRILQEYDDGRLDILCDGGDRFEIEQLDNSRAFLQAEVDFFTDDGAESSRQSREECLALHFEVLELAGVEHQPAHVNLDAPIAFQLAWALPADLGFKQQLLNIRSDAERTQMLSEFYKTMLPKLRIGAISSRVATHNGQVM